MGGVLKFAEEARKNMSAMAWDYYDSGALDEITLRQNRVAYERLSLLPRMLRDVSQRDSTTTVLGKPLASPLMVAPMAFQQLAHEVGESGTAKAVSDLGLGMVLSTLSTTDGETVRRNAQNQPLWFQLYVHRDRALTRDLIQKAEEDGFDALCVTVDAPLLGRRERDESNRFALPPQMRLPLLGNTSDATVESGDGSGLFKYFLDQIDPSLTWKDLEWMAGITTLPIIPKGILHREDAAIAAQMGLPAIVVSNHGGRQLDTAPATIDVLPAVVAAAKDEASDIEVYVDGGIRRGTDILKAISLGAQAVLVGRPVLWGLGVNGTEGAKEVMRILCDEFDLAMALSGCTSIRDITEDLVIHNHW